MGITNLDTKGLARFMEANGPHGVANLEIKGMVDRIYVGDHKTLLYIKYSWFQR